MTRPIVAVLDPIADSALARLSARVEVRQGREATDWPAFADAVIVRASAVNRQSIEAAQHLKVIGKHGVGLDAIDLEAADSRGITVVNTPGANTRAVAELTIALMLACLRALPWHDRNIRSSAVSKAQRQGWELTGARVGLFGFGAIGQDVARILHHGFSCQLSAFDPFVTQAPDHLPVHMANGLESLARQSDILTIHAPLTPETRSIINGSVLNALPQGAVVINAGRGGILEESALLTKLESGHLSGAGLDVFAQEPPTAETPLMKHPNVVASPHIGASTTQAMERMGQEVVEKVLERLNRKLD